MKKEAIANGGRWLRNKYGITDAQAEVWALSARQEEIRTAIDTYCEANGINCLSPLARGYLVELLSSL